MKKEEESRRKKKEEGRKKKEKRREKKKRIVGLVVVSWGIKKTDREFWFGSAVLYDVYV